MITPRLLPLQLLGERATATENKVYRLNVALAAETGNVERALLRTYSMAFDFGVESKIFTAPSNARASNALREKLINPDVRASHCLDTVALPADDEVLLEQVDRMCSRAMPIGDADHDS